MSLFFTWEQAHAKYLGFPDVVIYLTEIYT
jgi:hypothetical protein